VCGRVDITIAEFCPFAGFSIPKGDDQFLLADAFRYVRRVIGEADGDRLVKLGPVWPDVIDQPDNAGVGGRRRWVGRRAGRGERPLMKAGCFASVWWRPPGW